MTKSMFFKISYDVISCYYVTETRHQTNVARFFHFTPLPQIKISGYASENYVLSIMFIITKR